MLKVLILVVAGVLGLGMLVMAQPARQAEPDLDLLRLAVRATVHSWPTPAPREVVVTRVVEVTRIVEVTSSAESAPASHQPAQEETATPEPTATVPTTPPPPPEPTPEPVSQAAPADAVAAAAESAPAITSANTADLDPSPPTADPSPPAEEQPTQEAAAPEPQAPAVTSCPVESPRQYTTIPIEGGPADHPAHEHGDLNLQLRGSRAIDAHLGLVEISGPTDGDAPQVAGIFADNRTPAFAAMHQVFDWNWNCGGRGCRGDALGHPESTLAVVQTAPGERIAPARRNAEIYGGGFVALVLFADEHSVTLGYTREDSVANGYSLHLKHICVDPNLVAAYRAADAQGRGALPALRNGETLGVAAGDRLHLAIRDRGMFKDPRSRKDWWAR